MDEMHPCEWRNCGKPATILQRNASDRPIREWSTSDPPKWPDDFGPDLAWLCEEHAALALFGMADEYRAWTLAQLASINSKVQAIFDMGFSLGYLPPLEVVRLRDLVERHAALVAEARDFIHRLQRDGVPA